MQRSASSMTRSAKASIAMIDDYISEVGPEKTASEPLSEPGSIGEATEHPVKNVDDRLEKAKEGDRSAENSKDVKEDQGPPSVENAGTAKAASVFSTANNLARGGKPQLRQKKADGSAVM